jgi:hypothetical protein
MSRQNCQNVFNKYKNLTHPLTPSGTCEADAVAEVHTLHALGEHELVNCTCEREGKMREKDQMRNEEARASAAAVRPSFLIFSFSFPFHSSFSQGISGKSTFPWACRVWTSTAASASQVQRTAELGMSEVHIYLTPGADQDGSLASFIPEWHFLEINYKNLSSD